MRRPFQITLRCVLIWFTVCAVMLRLGYVWGWYDYHYFHGGMFKLDPTPEQVERVKEWTGKSPDDPR